MQVICAWCGVSLKEATANGEKTSHGICKKCSKKGLSAFYRTKRPACQITLEQELNVNPST